MASMADQSPARCPADVSRTAAWPSMRPLIGHPREGRARPRRLFEAAAGQADARYGRLRSRKPTVEAAQVFGHARTSRSERRQGRTAVDCDDFGFEMRARSGLWPIVAPISSKLRARSLACRQCSLRHPECAEVHLRSAEQSCVADALRMLAEPTECPPRFVAKIDATRRSSCNRAVMVADAPSHRAY